MVGQETVRFSQDSVNLSIARSLCFGTTRDPNRDLSCSHQQQERVEEEEAGTSLAVAALWSLDLAMNASLVAIRAVVADCAPPRQQVCVHACISASNERVAVF